MNNSNSSKTGLFLMELIIAILFFSISGAICVQLFVQSHITSKNSVELNHSVEWCQNVAEAFYGCNGNTEEMILLFENSHVDPQNARCFYLDFNKDFKPTLTDIRKSSVQPSDYAYRVSVSIYDAEGFTYCHISASPYTLGTSHVSEPIYTLSVQIPTKKEVTHE